MTLERDDFASNLHTLCSYAPSVAAICRKLSFNRQQFNKYLAGTVRPSRRNLRRICDYFGVTESELLLTCEEFSALVGLRRRTVVPEIVQPEAAALRRFYDKSRALPSKYAGDYYLYSPSFAMPGYFTRSFVRIAKLDGVFRWKNIEYLRRRDRTEAMMMIAKYEGLVILAGERIYVLQEEQLHHDILTQTIFYPTYLTPVRRLLGVHLSLTDMNRRAPAASRVVLERLSEEIDIRAALRACGQYSAAQIEGEIVEMLEPAQHSGRPILDASHE